MSGGYVLQDFEDDKRGYRYMYNVLAQGGTDLLYEQFLALDEQRTKDYWTMLINDIAVELTGLMQSMAAQGSGNYEEIVSKIMTGVTK